MFNLFTRFSHWTTYSLFGLSRESRLGAAIQFYIEDVTKIFFLLIVMIYLISLFRAGLDTDRIRNYLTGMRRGVGYLAAAIFGAVTPFCSCSSIPLFLAFTTARIPLGITMAFLITSPMINEVALVLLSSLFGLKFTLLYLGTGITAGIVGGFFLDSIGAERYLMPIGRKAAGMGSANGTAAVPATATRLTLGVRHRFAVEELKTILKRVTPWALGGIALGAALHGYIPEGFLENRLGGKSWWSVPAAVLLGIPLYSNASGMIPIAQSLLAKGLPAGTTLAFMMSVVAASFPEFAMLKQVMKPRLLLLFFGLLLFFFTVAGWVFNIAL